MSSNDSFSVRQGYVQPRTVMQVESMDAPLRNGLWNCVEAHLNSIHTVNSVFSQSRLSSYGSQLWHEFFRLPVDEMPSRYRLDFLKAVRDWFMSAVWYSVYDLLEYLARTTSSQKFIAACNDVMQREVAGYRFIGMKIVPIVSPQEILEVETALKVQSGPVRTHIDAAVNLLSDRQNPNLRKSIDESISAVEAAVRELTGDSKAMLPAGLKALDANLHPAQEQAFIKLYGYTSDESGIRHSLTDDSRPVDNADARYMLVACSAFVNYLRAKSNRELS